MANIITEEDGYTTSGHYYKIIVIPDTGTRNGYVGVTPKSNLYGTGYSTEHIMGNENKSIEQIISVHGGVTYSGCLNVHILGAENLWFFGFDCSHCGDGIIDPESFENILHESNLSPNEYEEIVSKYYFLYPIRSVYSEYPAKTKEYVREECFSLSNQIREIENVF